MSATKVGDRVGAILSADSKSVQFLGYGVYDGEHEPPDGQLGITPQEMDELRADGTWPADFCPTNPRITLDSGEQVWGYQCWWASEQRIREIIGTREVVMVNMSDNSNFPAESTE